ncbi:MAG: DUF917 family protein [Clostridiales bacterium]|nr:DUF917 family protein [Clostridiales bacterium]
MFRMTEELALCAVYGGWLLGGGGGGSLQGGLEVIEAVMKNGSFDVCSVDDLAADDTVVTGSLVGSPASGTSGPAEAGCMRAYQLFLKNTGIGIGAVISNESGAQSITNGWIAAAVNGLPVIDAACNGRAHPTGIMGAMELHKKPGYVTMQAAAGGQPGRELDIFTRGSIGDTSSLVRSTAAVCGGMVHVLRNPIDAAYIRENAAIGTLSMCISLGRTIRAHENDPGAMAEALGGQVGMRLLAKGVLHDFTLTSEGGFDVGSAAVGDGYSITFWNEYMTVEKGGGRLATFPDLIHLLDAKTGLPICSAAIEEGMEVMLVCIPKENLLLGSTMFDPALFEACEKAIGKPMIKYVF